MPCITSYRQTETLPGKRATAIGVESPEQLAFLGERGCDAAQGFLLGRPQGPSEIENLLLAAT